MNSGARTWLITGTLVGHRPDSRASALRMTRSRPRVEREEDEIVGDHEPDVEGDHLGQAAALAIRSMANAAMANTTR